MIKKLLILTFFALISTNSYAQFRDDILIQRAVSPQYAKIVVAENITRIENSELPKVSDTMGNLLISAINPQYLKNLSMIKDTDANTLYFSGEVKKENILKYQISRNLINTYAAYTVITGRLNNNNPFDTIQDLNGNNININNVKIEKIHGENFLVYINNEEEKTFIEGNIGTQLNIQIQAMGKNHEQEARNFLRTLQVDKLKKAIQSGKYTTTFAELEEKIAEMAKDPRYIKKLFNKQ